MNRIVLFVFVVSMLVLSTPPAHALGRLAAEIRLVHKTSPDLGPSKSGEMELVLTNTGDRAIEVVMEDLPYTTPRTGTTRPMFIVSSDDAEAPFIGRVIDFHDKDVTTISIEPSRTRRLRFNIHRSYRMEAGKAYTVSLKSPIRYLDRPSREFAVTARQDLLPVMKEADAPPVVISTPQNFDERWPEHAPMAKSDPPAACDPGQRVEFEVAEDLAEDLTTLAASHVNAAIHLILWPGSSSDIFPDHRDTTPGSGSMEPPSIHPIPIQ